MKGSKIIALWQAADKAVASAHAQAGGELGDYIRNRYDITYNGCSVCVFKEKKLNLCYGADCYDNPWTLRKFVRIGLCSEDSILVSEIEPDKDYAVEADKSIAEEFEEGTFKPKQFVVLNEGFRSIKSKQVFDSFDAADAFARRTTQEEIDICRRDSTWRRYTASCVRNDVQRAREHSELRHYEYYNCDGHRWWVSVKGVD